MSTSTKKNEVFDGQGDVVEFVSRVEIHGKMKGYTEEKLAYCLAEKLRDAAFNVFLRMEEEDKKDFEKVKAALYKEFKKEERNREEAVAQLSRRKRLANETIPTFTYHVTQLVKYAYPSFDAGHKDKLAKDNFVNGLSETMQLWLKSSPGFSAKTVKEAADLAESFEIAGVNPTVKTEILKVAESNPLVDEIADKVIAKLKIGNIQDLVTASASNDANEVALDMSEEHYDVNYSDGLQNRRPQRGSGGRSSYRYRNSRSRGARNNRAETEQRNYKCRSCQSTEHMFRACPTRFCQACGRRGHDAWERTCPNFQL